MARGKNAGAVAANLREQISTLQLDHKRELNEQRSRIIDLQKQLNDERRIRASLADDLAEHLVAEKIAESDERFESLRSDIDSVRERVARALMTVFADANAIPMGALNSGFGGLVGDRLVGDLFAEICAPRLTGAARRTRVQLRGYRRMARNQSVKKQLGEWEANAARRSAKNMDVMTVLNPSISS